MAITISPLELYLDESNPRFVILTTRSQADIRKYLLTYENVCQLVKGINEYGGLLPGERIVVLKENDRYVVIEGNRRTCSLQLLLSRNLIPDKFNQHIPHATQKLIENCSTIEVDVLDSRDAALELMSKRHIEGVMQWKPLAKKQFFAANYRDGNGQSISTLSQITDIKENEIRSDIREYKLFYSAYMKYTTAHPDFDRDIVDLKTDPFWRIFKAKFQLPNGNKVSPREFLKIEYDETLNTVSSLPGTLFEEITQLVFEQAIVLEHINTRHVLSDIPGIRPLIQSVIDAAEQVEQRDPGADHSDDPHEGPSTDRVPDNASPAEGFAHNPPTQIPPEQGNADTDRQHPENRPPRVPPAQGSQSGNSSSGPQPGGPNPGGPAPRMFFEMIDWHKLNASKLDHQGLLVAIHELYQLSNRNCGGQKAYKVFPNATGMILRTVYEQALCLRLKQINLWGAYFQGLNRIPPSLSNMETFIMNNLNQVFPESDIRRAYNQIIHAGHREFLNATIHAPGTVSLTADSLESIAANGMYAVIQWILDQIT